MSNRPKPLKNGPSHDQKLVMTELARKWMRDDDVQPTFHWGEFYDCMHEYTAAQMRQARVEALGPIEMVLGRFDAAMKSIGGCTDGACVIVRPTGMHTNGGCRCPRDSHKMQRAMYATLELKRSIRDLLDAPSSSDKDSA